MATVLSILVLAVVALLGGAAVIWRRGLRRQAVLMLILAAIAAINIAIWTVPDSSGSAPLGRELRQNPD